MNVHFLRHKFHSLVRKVGFDLVRYPPPDFDEKIRNTVKAVQPYTHTSPERIHALCDAVRHVVRQRVEGAIVECGVWRGGSMMAAALTLLEVGDTTRDIWLYDTFSGMVAPGPHDRFMSGESAASILARERPEDTNGTWCRADEDEVRSTLRSVPYPKERFQFVVGRIEETIPAQRPDKIAILRLDTDWYESTLHELQHLFPLLSPGGVLLIDDYGAWEGARRAVDEFFATLPHAPLLSRIDASGRIAVAQR